MYQKLVGPLGIYCTAVHSTEMYVSLSPIRNGWGKFVLHRACWMHRRSLDNFYLLPFLLYCVKLLVLMPYLLIMYYSCFMIVIIFKYCNNEMVAHNKYSTSTLLLFRQKFLICNLLLGAGPYFIVCFVLVHLKKTYFFVNGLILHYTTHLRKLGSIYIGIKYLIQQSL